MCGRFVQISDPERIKASIPELEINAGVREKFRQRFNIAPAQKILTVLNTPYPQLTYTHWGLVPFWAKDKSIGNRMINARAETITTKPSFREPFKKRRCIIFCNGFFEWNHKDRSKTPYFIRMQHGEPFAFAGLWDQWTDKENDEPLISSTIITTEANRKVAAIHDRMPAILEPDFYRIWLSPFPLSAQHLMKCIKPYPHDELKAYEISRRVNDPKNDSPEIIQPLSNEGQDPDFL